MAANEKTVKLSFYEIVIGAKPKVVRAFLAGLSLGSETKSTVFYSFLDGVHHEGKAEKLAEFVRVKPADCHIIVDAATSARFKKLAKRIPEEAGLEITSNRHIRSASFVVEYHAYAAKYFKEIDEVLQNLPQGLKLEDAKQEVKRDPSAKGIEVYSVAHDYEACGEGKVTGRVDLVIELKKKLDNYPLAKAEDIVLKLA